VSGSRSIAERLREEGDFFLPSTFARALASAFRSGPEAPIDLQTKLATLWPNRAHVPALSMPRGLGQSRRVGCEAFRNVTRTEKAVGLQPGNS
jgi:hypothetical protein